MKKTKLFFAAALLTGAAAFTACDKGNDPQPVDDGSIRFTAGIGQQAVKETRAAGTAWSANDEIGIFMVDNGTTTVADGATNMHYKYSTGTFSATADDQKLYFPMDGGKVDFIAYYPWKTGYLLGTPIDVEIGAQASQPSFDLLWTKADNSTAGYDKVTNKSTPVALAFEHKLTKMVMDCKAGEGVTATDLNGMTVTIKGMNTKNTFDLTTGTLAAANTVADITPRSIAAANGYTASYDAIVMPGTYAANDVTVEFVINPGPNAETFVWKVGARTLEGGNEYTFDVTLNRTGVSVTGTIKAWESVPREDVVAE